MSRRANSPAPPHGLTVAPDGLLVLTAEERPGAGGSARLPGSVTELRYRAPSLLVIGGPPAVGKSTLIDRAVADDAVVLCPDDRREALQARCGLTGYHPELWPEVFEKMLDDAIDALRAGHSAVLHATALTRDEQRLFATTAGGAGARAHLLYLDGNRALCDLGQAGRARRVDAVTLDAYLADWRALKRRLLDPRAEHVARRVSRSRARRRDDRRGAGMAMMAARGYRSVTIADRAAVNALRAIVFV